MRQPLVDLNTEKIIGCSKGSLSWWHEKGHIAFNKSERGMLNDYWMSFYFFLAVGALILHTFLPYFLIRLSAAASFSFSLLLILYEEYWCWVYAFTHKHKKGA